MSFLQLVRYQAWDALSLLSPQMINPCYCVTVNYIIGSNTWTKERGQQDYGSLEWLPEVTYWLELYINRKSIWSLLSEQCWPQKEADRREVSAILCILSEPVELLWAGFLPFFHSTGEILNYNQECVMQTNADSYLYPPSSLIYIQVT